jgi:hypothetical protein
MQHFAGMHRAHIDGSLPRTVFFIPGRFFAVARSRAIVLPFMTGRKAQCTAFVACHQGILDKKRRLVYCPLGNQSDPQKSRKPELPMAGEATFVRIVAKNDRDSLRFRSDP